ncbi:site-2 protease family protein [Oerskovia sp. M15]
MTIVAADLLDAGEGDLVGQVATMLSLLASLNIALFAFNLIPLPPLDGGHIAGALYEGPSGRSPGSAVSRVRGTPTSPSWSLSGSPCGWSCSAWVSC